MIGESHSSVQFDIKPLKLSLVSIRKMLKESSCINCEQSNFYYQISVFDKCAKVTIKFIQTDRKH